MRLQANKVNDVDLATELETSEFNITDGSKLIEMILDNAYKDPITAVVREICQNASEVDPNFRVHLPSALEPWLGVIDNGTGMSKSDVVLYASGIGASTKDKNNTSVGGFGIGMKVPFTVSDHYLIISRFEGMKYTFNAFKDEFGKAQFAQMAEHSTDEPNGIEVRVPIESEQFTEVRDKLVKALHFFEPKPHTNIPVEWQSRNYYKTGTLPNGIKWGLRERVEVREYRSSYVASYVVMGNLGYPIDRSQLKDDVNIRGLSPDDHTRRNILQRGFDVFCPIGTFRLPLSREAILYNPAGVAIIERCLEHCFKTLTDDLTTDIAQKATLYEATKYYVNSTRILKSSSSNDIDIRWKNTPLSSDHLMYLPKHVEVATLEVHDFHKKTLNVLGNLAVLNHWRRRRPDGNTEWETYLTMRRIPMVPPDELILLTVDPNTTKRGPSRLLRASNEGAITIRKQLWWFILKDGTTHSDIVRLMGFIYGDAAPPVQKFEDVVPSYKTTSKSDRSKATKLLLFQQSPMPRWGYGGSSHVVKDWWSESPTIDMNTTTGIYVDTRNYTPHGSVRAGTANTTMRDIVKDLKDATLIPCDTVVYGCPGSVKNKLKDHANFISLDETVDLAIEVSQATVKTFESRYLRYEQAYEATCQEGYANIFSLDMPGKLGYYTTVSSLQKAFTSRVLDHPDYVRLCSAKEFLRKYDTHASYDVYTDNPIYTELLKRYPLLSAIGDNADASAVADYIKLKELNQ